MQWGKSYAETEALWDQSIKQCIEGVAIFAWCPVMLDTGRWAWMERVWMHLVLPPNGVWSPDTAEWVFSDLASKAP